MGENVTIKKFVQLNYDMTKSQGINNLFTKLKNSINLNEILTRSF